MQCRLSIWTLVMWGFPKIRCTFLGGPYIGVPQFWETTILFGCAHGLRLARVAVVDTAVADVGQHSAATGKPSQAWRWRPLHTSLQTVAQLAMAKQLSKQSLRFFVVELAAVLILCLSGLLGKLARIAASACCTPRICACVDTAGCSALSSELSLCSLPGTGHWPTTEAVAQVTSHRTLAR